MTAYATETAQIDEWNVPMSPAVVSQGKFDGEMDPLGSWELPHEARSAAVARRFTRLALECCTITPDTVDQAVLVVSELVTNAIQHALPPVRLTLGLAYGAGAVHIAVADGGASEVTGAWSASCAEDERGRGRNMIALLTADQGTYEAEDGIIHWAQLLLAG